jgi:hypothetical protein
MAQRTELAELAGRRYWRREEGNAAVSAWRRSGLTLAEFAGRHGFGRERLRRWARREGRRPESPRAADGALSFYPVELRAAAHVAPRTGWIAIDLGDGRRVEVGSGFVAEELRQVLALLAETPQC